MGENRWTDLVARVGIAVLSLAVVFALLVLTGPTWPTLFVAMAAVVVALVNGQTQRRLAEQQTRLTTTLQRLALAPVLTGEINVRGKWEVRNVGKGPASDLRATVFGKPDLNTRKPWFEPEAAISSRPHLAPSETAELDSTGSQWGDGIHDYLQDVWIAHYADIVGNHYHSWCNWTRREDGDRYEEHGPWIFESADRSPETIRRNCVVCSKRDNARSDPPPSHSRPAQADSRTTPRPPSAN